MSHLGKPDPGVPVLPVHPDTARQSMGLPPYTQADAVAALEHLGAPDASAAALLPVKAALARIQEATERITDAAARIEAWIAQQDARP